MQGRSVPEPVRAEAELYPHRRGETVRADGERYDSARDNVARFVVYFGPYILWGSLGAMAGVIFLLTG